MEPWTRAQLIAFVSQVTKLRCLFLNLWSTLGKNTTVTKSIHSLLGHQLSIIFRWNLGWKCNPSELTHIFLRVVELNAGIKACLFWNGLVNTWEHTLTSFGNQMTLKYFFFFLLFPSFPSKFYFLFTLWNYNHKNTHRNYWVLSNLLIWHWVKEVIRWNERTGHRSTEEPYLVDAQKKWMLGAAKCTSILQHDLYWFWKKKLELLSVIIYVWMMCQDLTCYKGFAYTSILGGSLHYYNQNKLNSYSPFSSHHTLIHVTGTIVAKWPSWQETELLGQ